MHTGSREFTSLLASKVSVSTFRVNERKATPCVCRKGKNGLWQGFKNSCSRRPRGGASVLEICAIFTEVPPCRNPHVAERGFREISVKKRTPWGALLLSTTKSHSSSPKASSFQTADPFLPLARRSSLFTTSRRKRRGDVSPLSGVVAFRREFVTRRRTPRVPSNSCERRKSNRRCALP